MGDRAYTTLLAWPYPGTEHLPATLLTELEQHGAIPDPDTPADDDHYCDGSYVLAGDTDSGTIPKIVDAEANYGTCAFSTLIKRLREAGLSVLAWNEAGGDYGASWEYHPAGQDTAGDGGRLDRGELVVAASDLLRDGERSLDDVADSDLAGRVRDRLSTRVIPAAVKAVGL